MKPNSVAFCVGYLVSASRPPYFISDLHGYVFYTSYKPITAARCSSRLSFSNNASFKRCGGTGCGCNGRQPYFHSCLVAYVAGLGATVTVMFYFNAAQPALFYLVPACLLATAATAFKRNGTSCRHLFSMLSALGC